MAGQLQLVFIPGATIVCTGPNDDDVVFVVFQKKYLVNDNSTFGNSGDANNDDMWFALYTPLESHIDIGVPPRRQHRRQPPSAAYQEILT